jgi:ADP-Ribosyltransferase in polyvalent proteins
MDDLNKKDDIFKEPVKPALNQAAYTAAFTADDALAGYDPAKQAELRPLFALDDNPKAEARKQLLSHFLSSRNQMPVEIVYENFDHMAQVYNGGEEISSEALWNKTKLLFVPEQSKENPSVENSEDMPWHGRKILPMDQKNVDKAFKNTGKTTKALESGIYSTMASTKMLPVLAMDIAEQAGKERHVARSAERYGASNKPLDQQKWFMGKNWMPKPKEKSAVREYFLEGAKTYRDAAVYLDKEIGNEKNIFDTFKQDGTAAGSEKLFYEIVKTSPQLFTQIIFTLANPFAGPAYMGASAAGSNYLEVMDDDNMHMGEKLVNVTLNAGSEVVSEYIFSNPLIRGMLKGAPKSNIMTGFSNAVGKLVRSEGARKALNVAGGIGLGGLEETSGEILNQIAVNYTNIMTHKDGASLEKLTNEQLFQKLIVGVPDAAMLSFAIGGGFGTVGALQNSSYADMDLAEAEAKQVTQVRKEEILAKEDPTDQEIAELNEIKETENDPIPAPVLDALMDAAGMDTEQKAATKARRRIMAQSQPVDVETSAERIEAAVNDIGFAGKINIVKNQSELPDNIQQEAASRLDSNKVEGVIDGNNDIWFVAGNIRPDRAGKVILHEIVGHYGLNGAFGEKLNPLLNQIWNKRAGDIRLALDRFNYGFDYNGEAGKLAATEEFLARTAESSEKPKWWKEVIASARTFLRKVMPNMRFTDNDINSLIAKAGKYARQGSSQTGDIRFAAAAYRKKGAPNTADKPGQLRSGNVPHNPAVLNHYGIADKKGLYADYEFLYGKHPEYFKDVEGVKGIVESVLNNPEFAVDEKQHVCFLKEVDGEYYKVKVEKKTKVMRNHVRSIFKLNKTQYTADKQKELPRPAPEGNGLMPDLVSESTGGKQKALVAPSNNNINDKTDNVKFSVAPSLDSPEFNNWFGDSKVVDEAGKPLVVYHGNISEKKINSFDPLTHFGTLEQANQVIKWAMENNDVDLITMEDDQGYTVKPTTYAVFLNIENPLRVKDVGSHEWEGLEEKVEQAKKKGYDGFVYANEYEGEGDSYIPFSSSQVKSVNNAGSWDGSNPDIRFSLAPALGSPEFKSWFGDSKAVNESGEPLVVYHGSPIDNKGIFKGLAWFTTDKENAGDYSKIIGVNGENDSNISPVYLDIKKPKLINYYALPSDVEKYLNMKKYDGVIIDNVGGGDKKYYIVSESTQIKSAIGNNGEYDGFNPDIRFSAKDNSELIADHAAAIVPQVRRKEIASTSDLREVYPDLTEGQAENVLLAARDLMKKNDKKRNDELFRQWRSDVFPMLDTLEHHFTDGKIRPVRDSKNDISGSWIDFKNGEPSDTAAAMLGMEEDELIEALNGLTKKKVKAEYNKQYSDKATKQRYELEALQMRREEVEDFKNDILKGVQEPDVKLLRKYPEMSDFFEELITGKTKFDGEDVALARIAALSDPAADSSEMLDRYRILRHIQYLKDSDKQKHGTAARNYIADYARKFMPAEEQHRILKYLKKEIVSPAVLKKALKEIETFEMKESKMQELRRKLSSAYVQIKKISPRLRDHHNRVEVVEDLQKIARQLPDDVRKGELNKITKLLAKAVSASNEKIINRSVKIGEDEYGLPLYDKQPLTMLESLVDDAFNVVNEAVDRSEKNKAIEDIKKTFEWVKIGKTPKGIPEGKLTPDIQITVDKWRALNQLLPSQIADLKESLFNAVSNNPDDTNRAEELAALDLFGNLEHKDLEQIQEAQKVLDHLVDTGRIIFKDEIMEDVRQRAGDRADWIEYSTGGKNLMSDAEARRAAEKRKSSFLEVMKSFHRGNLSFEWLLNNLSRMDKNSESLKSPMARELSRDVHQSTQTESSSTKNKQRELTRKLEEIFDAKGRALDRKLNDFKKMQEKTKVFRYPDNNRPVMTMWLIEAEDLIRSLPEGHEDIVKLEDAVRRAKMDNKRKVQYSEGAQLGAGEEVPMSRDEALNFWLIHQQPDKRENMTKNNWTEESIKQLEVFLGDKGLALGKHLQDLYRQEYYSINDVFKRLFHINMPQLKNYAPAVFDVVGGKDVAMMPDAPEGMSGLNPGSLISRRSHNEKPKQLGASDVYLMHTYQMEHWKAWAGTVKRLRGVFMGKEVRLTIQQYYGKKAYSQMIEKINHFADGGNRNATSYSLIDSVRKGFTVSKLTFNVGVFTKQLTSLPAYAMDMPMKSFIKYSADFWTNPVKNAKNLIESTDYIKNRWGEGYERDVMRLLRDSSKKRSRFGRGIEAGMITGKLGDIIPILIGGHAVYQHHYNKMVRDGVHPDQAHRKAMLEFEMTTDRTQQAGNMKDLGLFQGGGSIGRMFTMFTTSPRQYYQHMSESFGDAIAGKKGAKSAAVKKILVAQIILPVVFQAVSDIMRKGFDEDEYDGGDYLRAMIVGPLNGLFVAGGIIEEAADALFAGKTYGGGSDSAAALSDRKYINRSLKRMHKIAREGDWNEDDLFKVMDEAASGTSSVFAPSAIYSVFRREKKRFNKLLGKKNKYE